MNRQNLIAALTTLIAPSLQSLASAITANYSFAPGESLTYEIDVKTEYPTHTKTVFGYLILHPQSVDTAKSQTTLKYAWGIKVTRNQTEDRTDNFSSGSLVPMFKEPENNSSGPTLVIDSLGTVISADASVNDAQLESSQGQAWRLVLPPLPPAGQTEWTTHRQLVIAREERGAGPRGNVTRVESPSEESVTYTADAPSNGVLTVHRKYEMTSLEKMGDAPVDHLHGDGQYLFDLKTGHLTKLEWNLTDDLAGKNVTVKIPITVTAHLLTNDEVAAVKTSLEQAEAQHAAAQPSPQKQGPAVVNHLPDGMVATEILGTTQGGGPITIVSAEHKPVIGFRIQTAEFAGRACFRKFEPLYEKPTDKPAKDETFVLARDGYAVGAITVNAGEFFNAFSATFMKLSPAGLDPKTQYTTAWYGKRVGAAQTKIGGDGKIVYGITGRKGLNFDSVALVTAASTDAK